MIFLLFLIIVGTIAAVIYANHVGAESLPQLIGQMDQASMTYWVYILAGILVFLVLCMTIYVAVKREQSGRD